MNKTKLDTMARQAIIAALYLVLTLSIGGFSYGPVQFRYSEILNLLAFYNPLNGIGITLGVFLSNLWSPLGMADLIFGTLHTGISVYFISKSKNLWIASLWPTVFSFIIGFELSVIGKFGNILAMTLGVMLSEFIIMTIIAVPVFKLLEKNRGFLEAIGNIRPNIIEKNKIN